MSDQTGERAWQDEEIEVRDARPEDRDAVFDLGYGTPEGSRVASDALDHWLADPRGKVLLAVRAGALVGILHLVMLTEMEAWLEGLSVAAGIQRQGIGRVLLSRALVAAHDLGAEVARLRVAASNEAALALFARFGFTSVAEVTRYFGAGRSDTPAPPLAIPGPADLERIWAWLVQSTLTPLNGGLEMSGERARALNEETLAEALAAGSLVTLEEWGTIQALAILPPMPPVDRAVMPVRYIDGLADGIGRLALALRAHVHARNYAAVTLWLPTLLILHDAMDGAGYEAVGEPSLILARNL